MSNRKTIKKKYDEVSIRFLPHILGLIAGKELLTILHSKWILYIWDTKENRALQGHRGSYKTTSITIIGIIWWLLFHPNDRIAIIRKKFTDASNCLKTILNIMKKKEIKCIFKKIHEIDPIPIISRSDKIIFNFKKTITPEGNIDAYGLESDITGNHYDKIICDDFVTPKDRVSRAERLKTKNVIMEIQANIIDIGKQVSYIGTPWHKEDCWSILPTPMKYDVNITGILTEEEIEYKRKHLTPSLFAANYELKHITSEDNIFKDAKFCNWDYKIKNVYGHLDAKFQGDHTNGLTFMARKKNGMIQAVGYCFHENVKDRFAYILKKCKKYNCKLMYIENNADKGFVADELRKIGISTKSYHESMNKHIKIETYLYSKWQEIDWDINNNNTEYLNQILDYVEGQEPDDCPDSAATLIREKFYMKNDALWIL